MQNIHEENLLAKYIYNDDLYSETDEHGIDIITLRYTLFQCRKQLLVAIQSLFDTEFAYGKVQLREDFDKLKSQCDALKNDYDLLKADFDDLIDHCKILVRQTNEILAERNTYYSEWEYAKSLLTPRPDWDKCVPLVINWSKLSTGKTSDELVDVIINEITHGNTDGYLDKNFQGRLNMRRRITGLLIKEIWEHRFESKSNLKFTDYVTTYLSKRFDNQDRAMEISTNLPDTCSRYRNNYEINLFWKILTGQMEENIYHHEMKEFARIFQSFVKMSSKPLWTILWSSLSNVLRELYPEWSTERISSLIQAAQLDTHQASKDENDFQFMFLFMEDDEGHIGNFLSTIRQFSYLDKMAYVDKIKDLLIGHPLVSMNQFKQVVQMVDPHISKEELQRYVSWVFNSKKMVFDDNKEIKSRDFEEILLRLECCSCFMH
ncbi:unnamed protein product [Adineta ricciae]|uniref:Uncharacterized protein n=1 Tax=Adineta ricciae TaxID=249248 RepID=A0A813QYF2_ADIRI|nr:unnamed protein product [Adineta ricciae]CAF1010135.1 unnamed protein product [Adineta ricciae]